MKIKDSKLIISHKNIISRFIDFDVVEAFLHSRNSSFTLSFDGIKEDIYVEPSPKEKGKDTEETK